MGGNLAPDLRGWLDRASGQPVPPPGTEAPKPASSTPAKPAAKGLLANPSGFIENLPNDALVYGVRHGVAAFGLGAERVMDGLHGLIQGTSYDDKVQGAAAIVNGLFQMGLSPAVVAAGSIGKKLEDNFPGLANVETLDPQFAGFIRTMMGQIPRKVSQEKYAAMSAEEQAAYRKSLADVNAPFTFREMVETAVTLAAPLMLAEAARKPKAGAIDTAGAKLAAETPTPAAALSGTAPLETAVSKIEALAKPKTPTEMQLEMQKITPEQAQAFVDRVQTETTPTVPPEGAQGPRMFGVNWQKLGNKETVNRVALDVNRELAGAGAMPATQGAISPTTAADISARAKSLGVTLDDVMRLPDLPARVTSIEQLDAFTAGVRGVRDVIAGRLEAEAQMAVSGSTDSRANVAVLLAMARKAALADKLTGENVAQAFGSRRAASEASVSGTPPQAIMDLVERINGMTDIDKAAEMITAVKRQQGKGVLRRFVDSVGKAAETGKDILWEVWVNDLLGPVTAGAKALGDTIMLAKEPGQITLARWNQKVFPFLFRDLPPGETITAGEASRFTSAAAQNVPTAVMQAIRGVKAGEIDIFTAIGQDRTYPNKLAIDVSGRPWQLQDAPAYLINTVGAIIRAPGTALGVITKVAKSANYAGAASEFALRDAIEIQGLTDRAAIDRHVKYVLEHPAEFPYIADAATKVANENTFTNQLGPFGQALTDTLNKAHLRSQAPFLNVPINLEKVGTQAMFPFNVPSMLMGDLRRDFEAGGSRRAMAMANVEAGAAFAGLIAYLTSTRIVTGYGPRDPALQKERELAGEPVHSIIVPDGVPVIGGKAFDYNRIKPIGTMIGLTATATEAWAQLPNDSAAIDRMGQVALIHALSWGRVIQDASYFTGIKEITDAISAKDSTIATAAQQFLMSSTRSLVPNTVRTVNRQYLDNVMREAHTVNEAFLAGIPGYSKDLAPHRDVIRGMPMEYPASVSPSLVMPLSYRETAPDPVYKMLADNEIPVHPLPWVAPATGTKPQLFGLTEPDLPQEGVPLTSAQRDRWIVLMTQEVRPSGLTLYDRLAQEMTKPAFQTASTGPAGAKADIVMNIVNAYKQEALGRLYNEDQDLKFTVLKRQHEKIGGKWLPITDPRSPQFAKPGSAPQAGIVENLLKTLGR